MACHPSMRFLCQASLPLQGSWLRFSLLSSAQLRAIAVGMSAMICSIPASSPTMALSTWTVHARIALASGWPVRVRVCKWMRAARWSKQHTATFLHISRSQLQRRNTEPFGSPSSISTPGSTSCGILWACGVALRPGGSVARKPSQFRRSNLDGSGAHDVLCNDRADRFAWRAPEPSTAQKCSPGQTGQARGQNGRRRCSRCLVVRPAGQSGGRGRAP